MLSSSKTRVLAATDAGFFTIGVQNTLHARGTPAQRSFRSLVSGGLHVQILDLTKIPVVSPLPCDGQDLANSDALTSRLIFGGFSKVL